MLDQNYTGIHAQIRWEMSILIFFKFNLLSILNPIQFGSIFSI